MPTSASTVNAINLPWIGFGTYQCSSEDVFLEALTQGYRHFDTAEAYGNEQAVGAAIKKSQIPRAEIFLTTKLNPGVAKLNMPFKDYQGTIDSFHESCAKLQVDYIDLYLIHFPLAKDHRIQQYKALVDLQKQGKIKHIGVSNYGIQHLEELVENQLPKPVVNQIELHPLCAQKELIAYMKEHEILPVAYSSLAPLSTWRPDEGLVTDTQKEFAVKREKRVHVFAEMAAKYQVSEAQLLLKWALQHDYAILPKSTNPKRIRENMELWHFEISEKDLETLDDMDENLYFSWSKFGINPVDEP